ncbi:wall-associated receptor kinase-like 10 [Corylus avellana]|nr:wall-associated receptor kinase-like 10 [Corylus avellana]
MVVLFQILLLLCSIDAITSTTSCEERCGNVSIPYPFGIGAAGCYVDDWYEVICNYSSGSPKPFLRRLNLEVLYISFGSTLSRRRNTVGVNYPTLSACGNLSRGIENVELSKSPFIFSQSENIFVAIGCNNFASITSLDGSVFGCRTCPFNCKVCEVIINDTTTRLCQTTIASDLVAFNTNTEPIIVPNQPTIGCRSAFLVEEKWFKAAYNVRLFSNMSSVVSYHVPVVLEWGVLDTSFYSVLNNLATYNSSSNYTCIRMSNRNSTFSCSCDGGYEGNPYILGGCQDINECERSNPCSRYNSSYFNVKCENGIGYYSCIPVYPPKPPVRAATIGVSSSLGLLVLLVGGWWSYKVIKKRRRIKQKNKFFKRNGGLLLQQQLSSNEANVDTTKLFNSKDLEKATDRFNVNRILGQGGQGTVYKGMLADGRIVAVKKSRVIDEAKLEEFINEVVILSQINHRNVVKLIGCCLETEVPLLVYEYIPNGTLFQYVNGQTEEFPLTWDMRLRIATEVAGALFYLHSAASSPIYHRDIKSTNILLDDKYRAKVADFGTSRSITVDQTHLTTLVHGTFGYLDPEYFQSSQFTEKSDVYSFGVVLAELLTGEKAISSTMTQESRSLATNFIQSIEENNLFGIIDSRVLKEGKKEDIIVVANLAKRCLDLNGKKRPTMKEVAMELEIVQMPQKTPNLQQNYEELEYDRAEMYEPWDAEPKSTMSTSSVDAQPLLSSQSA